MARTADKQRLDVHQVITDKIINAIERGAGDWQMPWHRPGTIFTIPKNVVTTKIYRGINILSLWLEADDKKFEHQIWGTFKQWQSIDAQVRKGEKGSLIVKYGEFVPKAAREKATAENRDDLTPVLYAKPAWVFNVDQVDGYVPPERLPRHDLTVRLAHVDDFIGYTNAEFRYGGQRAFYRHRSELKPDEGDFIQIPERTMFMATATSTATESFESTRLHELIHWCGAKHRLNRDTGERFGDEKYAFEELVAEIGASALCAHLHISSEPRADHAQYIEHWLKVLKSDKKAIFMASSLASKAVDYLYNLQPGQPALADGEETDLAE